MNNNKKDNIWLVLLEKVKMAIANKQPLMQSATCPSQPAGHNQQTPTEGSCTGSEIRLIPQHISAPIKKKKKN